MFILTHSSLTHSLTHLLYSLTPHYLDYIMDYPHRSRGRGYAPLPRPNPNGAIECHPPIDYQHSSNHYSTHYKDSYTKGHQPREKPLQWDNHNSHNSHNIIPNPPSHASIERHPSYEYNKSPPGKERKPSPPPRYRRREVGLVSPQRIDASSFDDSPHKQSSKHPTHNTSLPPINPVGQSATHTRMSGGTQNTGNSIGTKSSVRQSKYFRMYESGNQTKSILGQDNLCWDVNKKQGAYAGNVFDGDSRDNLKGHNDRIQNQPYDNNDDSQISGSKYYTDNNRSSRYRQHEVPANQPSSYPSNNRSRFRRRDMGGQEEAQHDMWSTTSRASY